MNQPHQQRRHKGAKNHLMTRTAAAANRRPNNNGGGDRNSNRNYNRSQSKQRVNVHDMYDKYMTQAKNAISSGDRMEAENAYQHADHYYRMIQEQKPAQQKHVAPPVQKPRAPVWVQDKPDTLAPPKFMQEPVATKAEEKKEQKPAEG